MRSELIRKTKFLGYLFSFFLFLVGWVFIVLSQTIANSIASSYALLHSSILLFMLAFANILITQRGYSYKACYIIMFVLGIIFSPVLGIGVAEIFASLEAKKVLTNNVTYKVSSYSAKATFKSMITYIVLRFVPLVTVIAVIIVLALPYSILQGGSTSKLSLITCIINSYTGSSGVIAYALTIITLIIIISSLVLLVIDFIKRNKIKPFQNKLCYISGVFLVITSMFYLIPWMQNSFKMSVVVTDSEILADLTARTDYPYLFLLEAILCLGSGFLTIFTAKLGFKKNYNFSNYFKKKEKK